MLIYYLINCALLPSWEQKYPFFARGLKLCKALKLCAGEASKARLHAEYNSARVRPRWRVVSTVKVRAGVIP